MKLSVTIITLNEEQNIERAVRSAQFADEVLVLDSFSTDKTVEIARSLGAKVVQENFLGFGAQKNLAAKLSQGPWIFSMDADEEISPELQLEICEAIKNNPDSYFSVNRRNFFRGTWIKYGGWYPDRIPRLYSKDMAQFTNPDVHEDLIPQENLKLVQLRGILNHYSFPTFESQVLTNLKYAKLGAQKLGQRNCRPSLLSVIFRPFWKFIECFLLKRGFLDGATGLLIAINASYSQFIKYSLAYLQEQKKKDV